MKSGMIVFAIRPVPVTASLQVAAFYPTTTLTSLCHCWSQLRTQTWFVLDSIHYITDSLTRCDAFHSLLLPFGWVHQYSQQVFRSEVHLWMLCFPCIFDHFMIRRWVNASSFATYYASMFWWPRLIPFQDPFLMWNRWPSLLQDPVTTAVPMTIGQTSCWTTFDYYFDSFGGEVSYTVLQRMVQAVTLEWLRRPTWRWTDRTWILPSRDDEHEPNFPTTFYWKPHQDCALMGDECIDYGGRCSFASSTWSIASDDLALTHLNLIDVGIDWMPMLLTTTWQKDDWCLVMMTDDWLEADDCFAENLRDRFDRLYFVLRCVLLMHAWVPARTFPMSTQVLLIS